MGIIGPTNHSITSATTIGPQRKFLLGVYCGWTPFWSAQMVPVNCSYRKVEPNLSTVSTLFSLYLTLLIPWLYRHHRSHYPFHKLCNDHRPPTKILAGCLLWLNSILVCSDGTSSLFVKKSRTQSVNGFNPVQPIFNYTYTMVLWAS